MPALALKPAPFITVCIDISCASTRSLIGCCPQKKMEFSGRTFSKLQGCSGKTQYIADAQGHLLPGKTLQFAPAAPG